MADELNIPTHRWYQPRNNISLPNSDFSKQWIYDSGIQKIDAWINGGTPAFSPASLFSTTAIGIWLDPSDLSTMFSDRAGTTPVTTPGTVVGLRLDKSKGLVLGAELVTNGDFATDTWWTKSGTTISGGTANWAAAATSSWVGRTSALLTVGAVYSITWTITEMSAGGLRLHDGSLFGPTRTAAGTYTELVRATGTNFYVISTGASTTASIDNISVRELAGNHATAPTDAARPTYGIEPKGGRRNLLLATDTLATQSLTVTAVAHTLAFTGTGTVTLTGASTAGPLVGTGAGNRVSLTFTPTAASLTLTVSGSVTLGQLELGSTATNYQRVTNDYDVTEAGVQTCHYCRYDGFNNSMSTAAIDFTATDKMSVFAGVRKLSDAAVGVIAELSADSGSNNGVFAAYNQSGSGLQGWGYNSRGTFAANNAVTSGYPAPISNVLTGLGDISGDRNTFRINGTQVGQVTTDQGTGNYGNYPLFIGRRGGTTLPFNGRDYGIIIVGKAASASEITDTELWLSDKTAEVDVAKSISPNIYTRSGDTILDRANSIIERRTV